VPDFVNTKTHLVRLLAAVAVSAAGCFFVTAYSSLSHFRFRYEHPEGSFSRATEFLSQMGWVGYAVPAIALLAGILALRRVEVSDVLIEIIIASTWLLSLVWFGSCLLFWEAQNIPVFSHMQFHF
jgi:hypothetical protein